MPVPESCGVDKVWWLDGEDLVTLKTTGIPVPTPFNTEDHRYWSFFAFMVGSHLDTVGLRIRLDSKQCV